PEVTIPEDEEQAQTIVKDYELGQVDLYVDASIQKGRADIGVYAIPSQKSISKVVASLKQADAHTTELIAISEAANWL
ncbi:MAG: hypothetical protein M1813_001826, partial [Trichoglossum hirsutum]